MVVFPLPNRSRLAEYRAQGEGGAPQKKSRPVGKKILWKSSMRNYPTVFLSITGDIDS